MTTRRSAFPSLFTVVFLLMPCRVVRSQEPEATVPPHRHPSEIRDAQSTSGPEPPPGVSIRKGKASLSASLSDASSVVIADVPAYAWRHGCGPTSVGMVLGYYDSQGYSDLFVGSATNQSESVNQGIASSRPEGAGHYEDYSLPKDSPPNLQADKSESPPGDAHASDSIADFMETSWSVRGNYYGWSWSSRLKNACTDYAQLRNPAYHVSTTEYQMGDGTLSWAVVTNEIRRNRPMVFLVDTDGDGFTDHFVAAIGVRESPEKQYGCLDTWDPYDEIRWCAFTGLTNKTPWSVGWGWSIKFEPLLSPPVIAGISCSSSNVGLQLANLRIGATNTVQRADHLEPGTWTNTSVFVSTSDATNRTESHHPAWPLQFYRVICQ
jgi:hypothetical protein